MVPGAKWSNMWVSGLTLCTSPVLQATCSTRAGPSTRCPACSTRGQHRASHGPHPRSPVPHAAPGPVFHATCGLHWPQGSLCRWHWGQHGVCTIHGICAGPSSACDTRGRIQHPRLTPCPAHAPQQYMPRASPRVQHMLHAAPRLDPMLQVLCRGQSSSAHRPAQQHSSNPWGQIIWYSCTCAVVITLPNNWD